MHRSSSSTRVSDEHFPAAAAATKTGVSRPSVEMDCLPPHVRSPIRDREEDGVSRAGLRERPLVLIFCAVFLWLFSNPGLMVEACKSCFHRSVMMLEALQTMWQQFHLFLTSHNMQSYCPRPNLSIYRADLRLKKIREAFERPQNAILKCRRAFERLWGLSNTCRKCYTQEHQVDYARITI